MRESHFNETASLVKLAEYIGKLEGGESSIGDFSTWFMNASWESRMADDSAALRFGWRIQNLLYQWQDNPTEFEAKSFARELRSSWVDFAPDSGEAWPPLSANVNAA